MNRRRFVRAAALSVTALLAKAPPHARSQSRQVHPMNQPDEVTALLNDQTARLHSNDGFRWTHRELIVDVQQRDSGFAVEVEAPGGRLSEVSLRWKTYETPPLILNDHWERTYGDASWHSPQEGEILPWYFMGYRSGSASGFGVKTGAKSMCSWKVERGTLILTLDTRSGGEGVRLGERRLLAAEIVATNSLPDESPFQTLRRFVGMMCQRPRMPAQPAYGINDWYFTYGQNSADLILRHTSLMAPLAVGLANRPVSVIDAGWFRKSPSSPDDCAWGDSMAEANSRFGDMATLAGKIRQLGMRPAIWTRPLCGSHADPPTVMLPLIKGRQQHQPVLDPTIPENLERITNIFRLYRQWGYELVKFDFTTFDLFGKWGFEMLRDRAITPSSWNMNDSSRTNAEIVLALYETIREAAGDISIISCNTFSHLSAGFFELNRIGDDTSGVEWARTRKMGVNTLAFRGVHHGAFYAADGDCVGLTTKVPWDKNRQWMELVAASGTPLFISAQPEAIGDPQKSAIREAFALASRPLPVGEPLDWMDRPVPTSWRLNGRPRKFDWDD